MQDQELRRLTNDELLSEDPKRRSAAAQQLVAHLDVSLTHMSDVDQIHKKEAQLKHSPPHEARDLDLLNSTSFFSYFQHGTDHARVSLLRALKTLSFTSLQCLENQSKLISLTLSAPTPKVRQSCAQLLSSHPLLPLPTLQNALNHEDVYFVRVSLILAIGRLSNTDAVTVLQTWQHQRQQAGLLIGSQEHEALIKAQSALLQSDSSSEISLNLQPNAYLTWCAPLGLETPLMEELSAQGWQEVQSLFSLNPLAKESGLILAKRPSALLQQQINTQTPLIRLRCAEGLCLVLSVTQSRSDHSQVARFEALITQASQNAQHLSLRSQIAQLSSPVHYRIDLPSCKDRASRQNLLKHCRSLMTLLCPQSVESPSAYQVQLSARFGASDALLLKLDRLSLPQGFKRSQDVGASMAHAVAASVARHSQATRDQLGNFGSSPYVVFDPTCGSGTLLFERALLSSDEEECSFVGQDISKVAYSSSVHNLDEFSILYPKLSKQIRFHRRSSEALWPWFDEALMNLPFGLRVTGKQGRRSSAGELEALYFKLFARAAERAKPYATLTCYSVRRSLLDRAASASHWQIINTHQLWSGGLLVHLISYRRA